MPTIASTVTRSHLLNLYLAYHCFYCKSPIILYAKTQINVTYNNMLVAKNANKDAFKTGCEDAIRKIDAFLSNCHDGKRNIGFLELGYNYSLRGSDISIESPAIACECPLCGKKMPWQHHEYELIQNLDEEYLPVVLPQKHTASQWVSERYLSQKIRVEQEKETTKAIEKVEKDAKLMDDLNSMVSCLISEKQACELKKETKMAELRNAKLGKRKNLRSELDQLNEKIATLQNACDAKTEEIEIKKFELRFDTIIAEGAHNDPLCLFLPVTNKNGKSVGYTVCLALQALKERREYVGKLSELDVALGVCGVKKEKINPETTSENHKKGNIQELAMENLCSKCGAKLDNDDRFCNKCGNAVAETVVKKQLNDNLCTKCNTKLEPDEMFCHKCGKPRKTTTEIDLVGKNLPAVLRRAFIFIEDSDWEKANEYLERILEECPENAYAYLGKMLVKLELNEISEIVNHLDKAKDLKEYKHAIKYGDFDLKRLLNSGNMQY